MADYDFVLNELGIMSSDLTEEKVRNQAKNQEGNEKQKVQAKSVGQ